MFSNYFKSSTNQEILNNVEIFSNFFKKISMILKSFKKYLKQFQTKI